MCEGIDGGNQPLDGSICLSPQEAQCNERFARQCRYEPPLEIVISLLCPCHGALTIFPVPTIFVLLEPLSGSQNLHINIHIYTQIHTHIHIHIHRARQHAKTETGDTEELNSEGNEKRRRQRESRVNSGVEKKKSSDKH